jgi:PASTA domain/IPT/TIG domain
LIRLRHVSILLAAGAASLSIWAPAAPAANVILGSPSPASVVGGTTCPAPCTLSQSALPGATLTAPTDGVVVRWRFFNGEPGKKYSLRILDPRGGLQFFGAGRSAEVTAAGFGLETFSTALPIRAGQSIGIDMEGNAGVAAQSVPGAASLFFRPPLGEGSIATAGNGSAAQELGFNAEIQQAPTITAISPGSGPLKGGNSVVIAGTELQGASAVSFGPVPARSFRVDSDRQITAVPPASAAPAAVPVSATTLAGKATSAAKYAYVADPPSASEEGGDANGGSSCVVPKLRGKKLETAKNRLRKVGCRIGKVRRKKGVAARAGRIVKQSLKPGTVLAPGTKVNVTLR